MSTVGIFLASQIILDAQSAPLKVCIIIKFNNLLFFVIVGISCAD